MFLSDFKGLEGPVNRDLAGVKSRILAILTISGHFGRYFPEMKVVSGCTSGVFMDV